MPVKLTKIGKGRWRVATPNGVKARATSLSKAKRQRRLLNAIDHGYKPGKRK